MSRQPQSLTLTWAAMQPGRNIGGRQRFILFCSHCLGQRSYLQINNVDLFDL